MQQMFGNNPMFGRAMEMAQGKSPEQLKETVMNLAKQLVLIRSKLSKCFLNLVLKSDRWPPDDLNNKFKGDVLYDYGR